MVEFAFSVSFVCVWFIALFYYSFDCLCMFVIVVGLIVALIVVCMLLFSVNFDDVLGCCVHLCLVNIVVAWCLVYFAVLWFGMVLLFV